MNLKRFRLLPPGGPMGWTPYAWLAYLPTFLIDPIVEVVEGTASAGYLVASGAALIVFLTSYFRGYWVRGRKLVPIIAVQTGLAIAFSPVNAGAAVLFIYAAAFAAQLEPTRWAARGIVLIALLAAATALIVHASLFYWIPGVGFTLLIGGVNLHYAQVGRAQRALRLAQEEVEHLATVAERERIARDLHDVLGHTLSLIVLKAELASRLATRDPARAAAEMRDVEAVARKTLQEVREAIRGYRTTLEDETRRARAMLNAAGIEAALDVDQDLQLPREVEEVLALSLREAVTNVVRHSAASRCTATLQSESDTVTLDVRDDGRGASAPEGSGLRGMRERVEALDGSITRPSGRGMVLRITIPLKPHRTAAPHRITDVAG